MTTATPEPIYRGWFDRIWSKIKPKSAVWRTTLVISIVLVVSQYLSLAFFWWNLYLPEMRQHAHYVAVNLSLLRNAEQQVLENPQALEMHEWIKRSTGIEVIRNPDEFPSLKDKPFAEFFTQELEEQLRRELHEPIDVYFEFKPTPRLWMYIPSMKDVWIREPLVFFAQYNPFIIIAWVIGVPILAIIAIVTLVRQLNRPLKRLELAARRVAKGQHATMLETQRGPSEIRAVNTAFNQMTHDIQQAAKDRTVMLAGISHDLRTPLTRLRLTAEMMSDKDLAEGMILDIQDMDAILDQFISFMRDGSDEPLELTDINAVLAEVAAQFSQQTTVSFQPEPLPDIIIRRMAIKRMIGNLVNNALRYGQAPIDLSALEGRQELVIKVRDHGLGIDEAKLPELMQPFVRGEAARTTQGSGLGLAIVARIVRMHKGSLVICNHPEGGLEVSVSLPLPKIV
ncbi:ATP-binding protein [Agitococcus lubricus]|uniref:histidine kinase n=1 Tax=Agitococcus lubricus TaxID=1077255 RepID=A0A2T5J487_9GAMM|nr:ATP-binding protein [Agitococcus lubricus]PTQ91412.1 two-component system osmolarity sensor histidine kinase EnvZ [Agitococcus lubricus]